MAIVRWASWLSGLLVSAPPVLPACILQFSAAASHAVFNALHGFTTIAFIFSQMALATFFAFHVKKVYLRTLLRLFSSNQEWYSKLVGGTFAWLLHRHYFASLKHAFRKCIHIHTSSSFLLLCLYVAAIVSNKPAVIPRWIVCGLLLLTNNVYLFLFLVSFLLFFLIINWQNSDRFDRCQEIVKLSV